jgi:hypothetical protein
MSQISSSIGTVGSPSAPVKDTKQMKINDLKSLIELGAIVEEYDIGGQKFVLKTANALERIRLSKLLPAEPTQEQFFEFEVHILASAVETLNGQALESYHPNVELDSIERKLEIISVLQRPVISSLIEKYNSMLVRCDAQFTGEEIKK